MRGFVQRQPIWQLQPLNLDAVRRQAEEMEFDAAHFYQRAASRSTDASIRKLLGDLAAAEVKHEHARRADHEGEPDRERAAPKKRNRPGACWCCASSSPGWPG